MEALIETQASTAQHEMPLNQHLSIVHVHVLCSIRKYYKYSISFLLGTSVPSKNFLLQKVED